MPSAATYCRMGAWDPGPEVGPGPRAPHQSFACRIFARVCQRDIIKLAERLRARKTLNTRHMQFPSCFLAKSGKMVANLRQNLASRRQNLRGFSPSCSYLPRSPESSRSSPRQPSQLWEDGCSSRQVPLAVYASWRTRRRWPTAAWRR